MSHSLPSPEDRVASLKKRLPKGGLFAEKSWLLSPDPFPLSPAEVRYLERLGSILDRFLKSCNEAYFRSLKGSLPHWIHRYLDWGKPDWLLKISQSSRTREETARVLRPDLILTEEGFALTELDNVPGGIGLTAWLNELYSDWDPEKKLIGGPNQMLEGFARVVPGGGAVLVSEESKDYRPEMEWICERLNALSSEPNFHCQHAENFQPKSNEAIYRFFELFDLENIPGSRNLAQKAAEGNQSVTAPFKPFLEEKMWLALFHSRPLRSYWERALRGSNQALLEKLIPFGWVLDPEPIPHQAVLPRLELSSFEELKDLSQKERELVIKISGYSELAWGSRSVKIGQDLSQDEWSAAIDHALGHFEKGPYVLQEFHKGRQVEHPYWDEDEGKMKMMPGRVRLCPYYFPNTKGKMQLSGVLATICPIDKKILHGMPNAILAPCSREKD